MGLFDNFKLMKDMVKSGIAAFHATEKLDALVETSQQQYASKLSPRNKKLYKDFQTLKEKHDSLEDLDAANAMIEEVEAAEVSYLLSLAVNKALPQPFQSDIRKAVEEYHKANDLPAEIVEKHLMRLAKTDEERQFVSMLVEEAKKDES